MNAIVTASNDPSRIGQSVSLPAYAVQLGDRVRNLLTGKLGTLERITRDEWKGTMTYFVRTGSKLFALPAGKLVKA